MIVVDSKFMRGDFIVSSFLFMWMNEGDEGMLGAVSRSKKVR
jgi:hypothetical protein